jgi:hypothetical protein
MTNSALETAARIAALNDLLRKGGFGGSVYFTQGVRARGEAFIFDALRAVRDFSAFTQENDPHGEHDFGIVLVAEKEVAYPKATFAGQMQKVFWKIDYYAPGLTQGSEDPSDPAKTARVMTVMLADEY